MFKKGFTLTEALIALVVIGFVALTILPTLINIQAQQKYKVGIKKAINTLNDSISFNITNGKGDAFRANSLLEYFTENMDIISSTTNNQKGNIEFILQDGMRFELPAKNSGSTDFANIQIRTQEGDMTSWTPKNGNCGTMGFDVNNKSLAIKRTQPCIILVDINGDKNPNKLTTGENLEDKYYLYVTDTKVFPYNQRVQSAIDEN